MGGGRELLGGAKRELLCGVRVLKVAVGKKRSITTWREGI